MQIEQWFKHRNGHTEKAARPAENKRFKGKAHYSRTHNQVFLTGEG